MKNHIVKVKTLNDNAVMPKRGTIFSAGYDLSACLDKPVIIMPGETKLIPTGLAIEMPSQLAGMIYPRSGLSVKKNIRLANCVAVIDSDYRGEIKVPLYNDSPDHTYVCENGERVAQLVFHKVPSTSLFLVPELGDSERGDGGFGSTGSR